ncbi:hypothetical protein JK358_37380 [Nocardia sp. 2]|uniref:Insoluble domain protein n=1 Tax=Nocardia acididurans TaxID=2802282 RepID=A0ABS1MJ60_9NOCA|nr:hypothetical protein [Nocardia acididurans]MBL1080085.1 hypothetical protein [Nocardia acididurans]
MSTRFGRKALLTVAAWPALIAVAAGVADAAPGQPGMAAPGAGQPGASYVPQPAAPVVADPGPSTATLADWVPEPETVMPVPQWRPRPQQQVQPQRQYQPRVVEDSGPAPVADESEPAAEQPVAVPVDPHTLRLGNGTIVLPDPIDVRTRDKIQAYVDLAEWNVAAAGDGLGLPRNESDRLAAGAVGGAVIGAPVAALVAAPVGAVGGCGVGALVGAVAGGLIGGIPTAGAMAVPGALIGGAIGCAVGGVSGGLTFATAGGIAGGLAGAGTGAVIGSADRDVALPAEVPPLMDAPAAQPIPEPMPIVEEAAPAPVSAPVPVEWVAPVQAAVEVVEQAAEQVVHVAEQVVVADPGLAAPVDSLRDALAAVPPVAPEQLGPLAGFAPAVNDALGAVQAGF